MSATNKHPKPTFRIIASIVLVIVAIMVWTTYLTKDDTPTAAENSRALIGGPFTLTNHMGQPVTDQDFLGKYMIVYFGYTYCPDVCPMDLQIMTDALHYLSPEQAEKINPVFVSVDPDRDTVNVMAEYVGYFHENLIGLTGTPEQIDNIKKEYRVYAAKQEGSEDYLVDHTAYIYLMDRNGTLLKHFNHGEDPQKMADQIAGLIE